MLKKCTMLISLFIIVTTSFAQYPLLNSPNILIHSRELGEEFSLFIPDTATQVLFNPARAFRYGHNFFYTTYYSSSNSYGHISSNIFTRIGDIIVYDGGSPITYRTGYYSFPAYSSITPTISVASLLNINNSKWLLVFSNGIQHSDNQYEDNESRVFDYIDRSNTEILNRGYSTKEEMSSSNIHITKIEKNYSVGLFATLNRTNIQRSDYSLTDRQSYYDYIRYYDYRKQETAYDNSGTQYQFGASFSLLGEDYDYIGKISYQQSDYEYDGQQKEYRNDIDSIATDTTLSFWNIRKHKSLGDGSTFIKSKPKYYRLYNYYQTKTDLFAENDHIFFKADAIYSTDKINYDSKLYENYNYGYNDTIYTADSTDLADNGNFETKNYWITLSAGYVIKYKLDDISVLLAIYPEYQYFDIQDIFADRGFNSSFPQNYLKTREKTMNTFSLQTPLYFHYTPNTWIEFYGGIIYRYSYAEKTEKSKTLFDPAITSNNRQIEENEISKGSYASSFKSKFLGVKLKHRSGLRLQISFNRNILDFSYWNFSLGYHF